jgi:hypothetical protein
MGEKLCKSQVFSNDMNGSKRAHMSKSQMKTILITLFYIKGIVRFEFTPQRQTVMRVYYMEILKQLHEAMRRKRPELWLKY